MKAFVMFEIMFAIRQNMNGNRTIDKDNRILDNPGFPAY